jgi:hypothetical protein
METRDAILASIGPSNQFGFVAADVSRLKLSRMMLVFHGSAGVTMR